MICAAPGHVLIGRGFRAASESRVLAWIAGEEWKLDAYRRFDAARDPRDEPYCALRAGYSASRREPTRESSRSAASARPVDLAFGYMGGLGAWRKFERRKIL